MLAVPVLVTRTSATAHGMIRIVVPPVPEPPTITW